MLPAVPIHATLQNRFSFVPRIEQMYSAPIALGVSGPEAETVMRLLYKAAGRVVYPALM